MALGRQDVDIDGLTPPAGVSVLGMSSDHLVLDIGDEHITVGDEIRFGLGYGALVRAMTSPFVTRAELRDLRSPARRTASDPAGSTRSVTSRRGATTSAAIASAGAIAAIGHRAHRCSAGR